jgi:hypothetical protein
MTQPQGTDTPERGGMSVVTAAMETASTPFWFVKTLEIAR